MVTCTRGVELLRQPVRWRRHVHCQQHRDGASQHRRRDGSDTLTGGSRRDVLAGGDGNDILDGKGGVDDYFGEGDNDTIEARDGLAERISCGAGRIRRATTSPTSSPSARPAWTATPTASARPSTATTPSRASTRARPRSSRTASTRTATAATTSTSTATATGSSGRSTATTATATSVPTLARCAATRSTRTATTAPRLSPSSPPWSRTAGRSRAHSRCCARSWCVTRPQARASCCAARGPGARSIVRAGTVPRNLAKVVLHRGFSSARLRPGARLRLSITAKETIGRFYSYTVKSGELPKSRIVCRDPGKKKGRAC